MPEVDAASLRVRAVAVCGCGHDGRLGLGPAHSSSDAIVLIPELISSSLSSAVCSIHVGGYHTIVCTSNGLYGWGLNESGQLGLSKPATPANPQDTCVCKPTRLTFFDTLYAKHCNNDGIRSWQDFILCVSCGAEHSMILTSCGLYATGCNQYGQLGLGEDAADTIYEWTLVCASTLAKSLHLTNTKPCCDDEMKSVDGKPLAGDVGRQMLSGQVTAVSCGTHHTLLAWSNVRLQGSPRMQTRSTNDITHNEDSDDVIFACPVLVLACGKGDFGELGYDGDDAAVQRSRDRRQQHALQSQLRLQAVTGVAHVQSSNMSLYVSKPRVQRRPEFFSGEFRIVQGCEALHEAATTDKDVLHSVPRRLAVRELNAMHLHSALTLDVTTPNEEAVVKQTYHWGCYYCNAVEDAAASRARLVQPVGWRVHAGNEILLRYAPSEVTEEYEMQSLVYVMGSGILGLGVEDSVEKEWRALSLPVQHKEYSVRRVTGRDHTLMLLTQHALQGQSAKSEADSPAQVVLGFGDNLHGQLGKRSQGEQNDEEEESVVVRPVRVLSSGDILHIPQSTQAWEVVHIVDAQAGARHSVFLVDVICRS